MTLIIIHTLNSGKFQNSSSVIFHLLVYTFCMHNNCLLLPYEFSNDQHHLLPQMAAMTFCPLVLTQCELLIRRTIHRLQTEAQASVLLSNNVLIIVLLSIVEIQDKTPTSSSPWTVFIQRVQSTKKDRQIPVSRKKLSFALWLLKELWWNDAITDAAVELSTFQLFQACRGTTTAQGEIKTGGSDVTVLSKICSELIFLECKPFSSQTGIYIPSLTGAHSTQLELDWVTSDCRQINSKSFIWLVSQKKQQ